MNEKAEKYYRIRDVYNTFKADWESFWFLMKTGFNGLYRENKKGHYNVPFGRKHKITFDENKIYKISDLIKNVSFYSMDYQEFLELVIKDADKAFIYNDPPYVNSQKYTADNFDNYKLANYIRSLGMDAAISDVDSKSSNDVYKDFFKVQIKSTKRVINIASVQEVKEVLYINYDI
jgi:DNA adenine methylase